MGFNGVSIIMFMGLGVFGVYWHYWRNPCQVGWSVGGRCIPAKIYEDFVHTSRACKNLHRFVLNGNFLGMSWYVPFSGTHMEMSAYEGHQHHSRGVFSCFFAAITLKLQNVPEMSWMCYTFWGPIGWSSLMFLSNSLANSSQFLCECLVSSCVYFLAQCTKAARARHFTQPRQGRLWPNYTWPGQLTTNQGRLIPHKQIKHVHPDSKIIHQGLFTQIQGPQAIPDLLCLLGVPKLD